MTEVRKAASIRNNLKKSSLLVNLLFS